MFSVKKLFVLLVSVNVSSVFAADVIDLSQQKNSFLRSFLPKPSLGPGKSANNLREINQSNDFNNMLHVRLQQNYLGYPIWGADAVVHVPQSAIHNKKLSGILAGASQSNKTSMNGMFYQNIQKDLAKTPAYIFSTAQAEKALDHALALFGLKKENELIKDKKSQLIVYIDKKNIAHWAFHVSFYLKGTGRPSHPSYLLNAEDFTVYKKWNNVRTLAKNLDKVKGGGFGGNSKIGKLVYDGLSGNLPALDILRDRKNKLCFLANEDVTVSDFRTDSLVKFSCHSQHHGHNNVFWDGESDQINEAYSPSNDALYAGKIVKEMYQSWYNIPVLTDEDGKAMVLSMITHSPNYDIFGNTDPDNAFWSDYEQKMYFGDGFERFYPLTSSIGVAGHEITHGFTYQHSNLMRDEQAAALDESFSDMAAQAVEFYAFGKNSWKICEEIWKESEKGALRYLDEPTKDCKDIKPEDELECSIDNAKDYYDGIDPHHASGVFNRAFYLLANSPGWSVKKAFDVMVKANQHYWTSNTTFNQAACGVIWATRDYGYEVSAVTAAFNSVGINTNECYAMV